MLRFKPEVRIVELTAQLADALTLCAQWSLRARVDVEINSIDDGPGVHQQDSLHGSSLAVDADTVGDKPAETESLGEFLRRRLPAEWDVVFEGDHVHSEWDMHRRPLRRTV
jgi:hypothetical protein